MELFCEIVKDFSQKTPSFMFKWVLNTPLKLEYNLNIYLALFELKKLV